MSIATALDAIHQFLNSFLRPEPVVKTLSYCATTFEWIPIYLFVFTLASIVTWSFALKLMHGQYVKGIVMTLMIRISLFQCFNCCLGVYVFNTTFSCNTGCISRVSRHRIFISRCKFGVRFVCNRYVYDCFPT